MPHHHRTKRRKQASPPQRDPRGHALSAGTEASETRPHQLRTWWKHGIVVAALTGLCAVLYGWTLHFPMEFDDHVYLIDNPLFPDPASFHYPAKFVEFANRPASLGYDPDFAVNFILRPVAYGSFFLNHLIDGFNPRYYRLGNIVIHAGNAVLLYALLQVLLGRFVRAGTLARSSAGFISLTAALLFAAHPLATESVTYIVQRFTSLAATFSLLALWLHFLSLETASRRAIVMLRAASVAAVLLAMQTKECGFTVPFLAVLLDRLILGSAWRNAIARALPLLLCTPLIPILVVLTATAQNDGWLNWERCFNIVNAKDDPFAHSHYLITQITVLAHYLRLLVWPSGLNLDPEWTTYRTLWQGPVLGSLSVLALLAGAAGWLFRRQDRDVRLALPFAALIWFFVTVSVSSGLVPLPDLVAEHRSYFPSIGIFILTAALLDRARTGAIRFRWARILVPAGAACSVAALSWVTCARNEVWRDEVSLWKDTVAKSPGKFRVWGNLGTAYSIAGDHERAVECYIRALRIEPRFQTGMLNLARSFVDTNRPAEALELAQRLVEINGGTEHVSVALVMGVALTELRRYADAEAVYRRVLAADPWNSTANLGLGLIYHQAGYPDRALDHYYVARRDYSDSKRLAAAISEAQKLAGIAMP